MIRWYMLARGNVPVSEFTADVDAGDVLPSKAGHRVVQAPWTGTERPDNYRWNADTPGYETFTPAPVPESDDSPPPTDSARLISLETKMDTIIAKLEAMADDSGG